MEAPIELQQKNLYRNITLSIAEYAINAQITIPVVLDQLANTNWDIIFEEARHHQEEIRITQLWFEQQQQENRQHYLNEEIPCKKCRNPFIRKDMKQIDFNDMPVPNEVKFRYDWYFCADCYQKAIDEIISTYRKVCVVCDKIFWDNWGAIRFEGLCDECSKKYKKEWHRVISNNRRTEILGLESTLTLKEWIDLIEKYNGKCAYCKINNFEEMDHVISVYQGGGTTVNNIVPCCRDCNKKKYNYGIELVRSPRMI